MRHGNSDIQDSTAPTIAVIAGNVASFIVRTVPP